jgi:hypothetical protein
MLKRLGQNCFRDCPSLTTGNLSNTQITEVAAWAFGSCNALTSIKFPSTLTTIGNNVFLYCPVEIYVFPHNVNSVGADTLAHQSKIKVLIMPEIDETHKINTGFLYGTRPNVIIYSGDNVEFFKGQFSSLSGYDVQPFENYVYGTTYKTNTIFYGAGKTCSICNGLLAKTDNPCVTDCTYCGAENLPKANPVHNLATTITYASYELAGTKTTKCLNEGCAHSVVENTPALFTCLGYSAPMNGNGGIAVGFAVNKEAIKVYEEATGKSVSFGVYAVAQQKLAGKDIFDADGNIIAGAINADLTSYSVDVFEIKIVGFTDKLKDVLLSMGAYATEDGKSYSYMQSDKAGELVGNYYAVSYNSVIASLKANEVE